MLVGEPAPHGFIRRCQPKVRTREARANQGILSRIVHCIPSESPRLPIGAAIRSDESLAHELVAGGAAGEETRPQGTDGSSRCRTNKSMVSICNRSRLLGTALRM